MEYMVVGTDGKDYGPVGVDELKNWAAQNRVAPHTTVKDFVTGRVLTAGEIPGLFGAQPAPPAATPYGTGSAPFTPSPGVRQSQSEDMGPFLWVIGESVLGIVVFFLLHGLGLILTGYAVFRAIALLTSGSRFGIAALIISILALAIVGGGWLMRLGGTPV